MPDKRKHRGQHPADAKLFASSQWNKLKQATHDLSWLLSHGYAEKSALKLVGDRFRLKERQRRAVVRSAAAEQAVIQRHSTRLKADQLKGQHLHIDGFNLLITIESALSGGLIFEGVDGCYRDLASIHGSYKRVIETEGAIEMIGKVLEQLKVKKATWYFDKPVSNSGSLKVISLTTAEQHHWDWEAELPFNPDKVLKVCTAPIVTTDAIILDHAQQWFNLARYIIDESMSGVEVVRLTEIKD
jgi:hypothetical protein